MSDIESDLNVSIQKTGKDYYKVKVGKQVIRLTGDQFTRFRREVEATRPPQNAADLWLDRRSHHPDVNPRDLSIDQEYQIMLLLERFTEISGIGDNTASKIIDLLIVEGISEVSIEEISEIDRVGSDTAEKIWLYILGLQDGTEEQFKQLV